MDGWTHGWMREGGEVVDETAARKLECEHHQNTRAPNRGTRAQAHNCPRPRGHPRTHIHAYAPARKHTRARNSPFSEIMGN